MDPILEQFISEARENLSYLDSHLEDLKDGDSEAINALFRAAHTLKGGAGLVGLTPVKEVTHAAEDLLDAFRQDKIEYSDELLDTLYDAFDEVVEIIDAVEETGSNEVEVDEERIKELESNIRSLLSNDDKKEEEKGIETNLNIAEEIAIGDIFSESQVENLIKEYKIPLAQEVTQEYLDNENLFLLNIDLESDTVELGNDPFYLLYMLYEDSHLLECGLKVGNCEELKESPLSWITQMGVVIKASQNEIEDIFYNVLDDIEVSPLSMDALLNSYKDSGESSLMDEFKGEMIECFKSNSFDKVEEKIEALLQIVNPDSLESFVLKRAKTLLGSFQRGSDEYKELLKLALLKIGFSEDELKSKEAETKPKNAESKTDKEIESAINILKAQENVLKISKDKSVVGRTKMLLKHVLGFLDTDEAIDEIEDQSELLKFVQDNILKLSNNKEKDISSAPKEMVQKDETPKPKEQKIKKEQPKAEAHHSAISKTVKIDQTQIDSLMDIVGELLVMKNALPYIAESFSKDSVESAKRELMSKYGEISRLTDQLQDSVMGMRLLPLSYIFGRYPKLVRDISKKLNKKIKYIEEGGETKLDKGVIEKLADPLVHIIRNSLDHGLETPDERKEHGKDETGVLKISAKPEGDKVYISISDDGRGVDEEKIVMKAIEKGLIDVDKVDNMSKEEKLMLLFLPGLSTKEQITDLSGRGVGTDAVKSVIDELGGAIHITSDKGKGTTTTLEIPLSVALTNVFHVVMNRINYAIAMDYIVETDKIEKDKIKTANHNPFMNLRGELIPLIFEERLLGNKWQRDEYSVVVIQTSELKYGLVVDRFVGQLDVVQKPMSGAYENHPFINGTSLLGNGDVLFVLDPRKIVR